MKQRKQFFICKKHAKIYGHNTAIILIGWKDE